MSDRGRPQQPPRRIVSLVPSLTEALFTLGLGERVVGVTEWCVHPAQAVAKLPKLGGTKNPCCDEIVRLSPDVVIVNVEENRREDYEELRARGVPVFVAMAETVYAAAESIARIGALIGGNARPHVRAIRRTCTGLRSAARGGGARRRRRAPVYR